MEKPKLPTLNWSSHVLTFTKFCFDKDTINVLWHRAFRFYLVVKRFYKLRNIPQVSPFKFVPLKTRNFPESLAKCKVQRYLLIQLNLTTKYSHVLIELKFQSPYTWLASLVTIDTAPYSLIYFLVTSKKSPNSIQKNHPSEQKADCLPNTSKVC